MYERVNKKYTLDDTEQSSTEPATRGNTSKRATLYSKMSKIGEGELCKDIQEVKK